MLQLRYLLLQISATCFSVLLLCGPIGGGITIAYAASSAAPCPYIWNQNLKIGSTGPGVKALQQFLNNSSDTQITISGIGSPGNESSTFGSLTAKAVTKFQEKYAATILTPQGLTIGTGSVGNATRAELNALCTATATSAASTPAATTQITTQTTGTDSLTISDPGQPASSIAPAGAFSVPFISVTLTAGSKDIVVNSITVHRVGLGSDGAFASISINGPDGLQIGNQIPLNSNHIAIIRGPFTVPAGTSQTLSVVGNMNADLTDFDGQAPQLQIDSIDALSPVTGPLPFLGAIQTANNSYAIGGSTLTRSSFDPGAANTHFLNDTGVRFSGIRITANSGQDLALYYMIWQQTGTVSGSDLANVVTMIGTSSTLTSVSGSFYISKFNPAIVIPKVQTIDMYIQGDLKPTSVGRTVEFDIADDTDDIGLVGNVDGFGANIFLGGNTASSGGSAFLTDDGSTDGVSLTPFYQGSKTSIESGSYIIQK